MDILVISICFLASIGIISDCVTKTIREKSESQRQLIQEIKTAGIEIIKALEDAQKTNNAGKN